MTDVRAYTADSDLPAWAFDIIDLIRAEDLEQARHLFAHAAAEAGLDDAIYIVAAAIEPGPDAITFGSGPMVFGNPLREGYAWRCGTCLHAFRTGGRLPAAGVNYKTLRGAATAAIKHNAEDHGDRAAIRDAPHQAPGCGTQNTNSRKLI